jgi:hypothetical protein
MEYKSILKMRKIKEWKLRVYNGLFEALDIR